MLAITWPRSNIAHTINSVMVAFGMAREASEDRLVIGFDVDRTLDLDEISESFSALSRQYKKLLAAKGYDEKEVPAKLLVTRLEVGSLETELAAYAAVSWSAIQTIDAGLILTDFSKRIRRVVSFYSGGEKDRPADLNKDDARDFESFLKPIAGRRGAKLNIRRAKFHKKSEKREILAEYEFGEKDLAGAFIEIGRELEGNEPKPGGSHQTRKKVHFRWAQTNWGDPKDKGRTGDRGIIPEVSDQPLPVYFPSKDSVIKHQMTGGNFNPSKTIYIVDVDVRRDNGEPSAYTIMAIHKTDTVDDEEANDDPGE